MAGADLMCEAVADQAIDRCAVWPARWRRWTAPADRNVSLFLIGTEMDYEVEALTSGLSSTTRTKTAAAAAAESFHV